MTPNHLLIDGHAMMFRAFYGAGKTLSAHHPETEEDLSMVYAFGLIILQALEQLRPNHIMVAFDRAEKTFRHEADTDYKAQRGKAPDVFFAQVPHCQEMLEQMHIPTASLAGYEADDIIGTLALRSAALGNQVEILSHDLDYTQLVSQQITLCRPGKRQQIERITPAEVVARYGLPPEQMVDYKALIGDSSDNYKGIEGIGPKAAKQLLERYGSITQLLSQLETLPEKWRKKIAPQVDSLLHCQHLAAIHTDVPLDYTFTPYDPTGATASSFFMLMGFPSLYRRWEKYLQLGEQPLPPPPAEQPSLF
ncbi:hypothetical protein H6771_03230 [Candidatus Peribacteria bacterium]|nr:hypothetical protein [Candidatus Peribacteria bacterium]